MKALSVITLLTLLSISCAHEAKNQSSPNSTSDTITPAFLKQEEAALLLQKEDEHIRRWSSFDLASHTVGIEGGKQGYLQFAGAQTRNWNDEETALLMKSSQFINQIIREKELKLPFPEKVRLIKSTIKEEGGAGGYTRDTYIVLIDRLLEHPEYATKLLAHEAFHVLTRNNPDFRKKMYSVIGFNILPKEIEFPEELKERFISNPDVIRHDSYATFTINSEKKDCCMIIYATKPYEGGNFFQYLNIGLVPIDKNSGKAMVGVLFSLSLAAYGLLIGGVALYIFYNTKRGMIYVTVFSLFIAVIWIMSINYNSGENYLNKRIFERLIFEDGEMMGANRTTDFFQTRFDRYVISSDIWFGVGRDAFDAKGTSTTNILNGCAGWKRFYFLRGVVGCFLLLLFLFSYWRKYPSSKAGAFLILFLVANMIRDYPLREYFLFIYLLSIPVLYQGKVEFK